MAPSAAELYPLHWWSNRYFKKKKSGNYCKSALSQKLMSPLYTQITKNEDFKALDLWIYFFLFFEFYWPTSPYGPWLPGCLLQRRISEADIFVCMWYVQSTIFLCSYSPTLLSGSTKWKNGRIEHWAEKWPIRASKRQITDFFCHDRFFPGNCVIGILRILYIIIYYIL